MQEKDLKQKLNQELEEMAPDILENILSQPRVPVKNEKELFGDNKPLFREKKNYKKLGWFVAAAAMFIAVIAIATVVTITNRSLTPQTGESQVAYSIMIDVNPSVVIDVGSDGKVVCLSAGNDDAKEIVELVNKKITKDTTYNEVISMVVKSINKRDYFKKKDSAMLVSIVADNEDSIKGKKTEVKDATAKIIKKQKIGCKAIYQECIVTDKITKIAEKNNVSVGKATLCVKLAEKEQTSVSDMCKKKISVLVKKAEKFGIIVTDEIVDNNNDVIIETQNMEETEVTGETEETESIEDVEETESIEENVTESAGDENAPAELPSEEETPVD